jgi:Tol biopolymer transport system component
MTILCMTACLEKTGPLIPKEKIPDGEIPKQEDSLNIVEHDIYFRSNRDGQYDIYKMNIQGEEVTRVTETGGISAFKFTPDGLKIIYQKNFESTNNLYMINSDGSGENKLTDLSAYVLTWDLSADSKKLVYSISGETIYLLNLETFQLETFSDTTSSLIHEPKFLSGADKIVYLATDYALKVFDTKDGSIQSICDRCIYEEHHFQAFPNEEKVLIQMSQYGETYIFTIDPPSKSMLSFGPRSPQLTPDGKGFVFGTLTSGCLDSIMIYNLNTSGKLFIKSLASEGCAALESGNNDFSFSPEGSVILWNSGKGSGNTRITADIFMIDIQGNNYQQLTDHPAEDCDAVFQPIECPTGIYDE